MGHHRLCRLTHGSHLLRPSIDGAEQQLRTSTSCTIPAASFESWRAVSPSVSMMRQNGHAVAILIPRLSEHQVSMGRALMARHSNGHPRPISNGFPHSHSDPRRHAMA